MDTPSFLHSQQDDNQTLPLTKNTTYNDKIAKLSELSVKKYYDPYIDIDWNAPENKIDHGDPRFCLPETHALAKTQWYKNLSVSERSRFGLNWIAQQLKYGVGFEAILCRGLLEFCQTVPNNSEEFRYAMHEVIEEGRHSLMFQEFINRTKMPTTINKGFVAWIDDRIAHLGKTKSTLFFFTVLSGEIFGDCQNRTDLNRPKELLHPLYRQILKIHVMEEARHICFAKWYLQEHMAKLSRFQRFWMGCLIPLIFFDAARMMLSPDTALIKRFNIPTESMSQAFGRGSVFRRQFSDNTVFIRELCQSAGMMGVLHRKIWRRLGEL